MMDQKLPYFIRRFYAYFRSGFAKKKLLKMDGGGDASPTAHS